jgi:hypothetical protein
VESHTVIRLGMQLDGATEDIEPNKLTPSLRSAQIHSGSLIRKRRFP